MKRVNDKMLIIDGEKFKAILESKTGKTLKELSLENGYSDSFLRMVVKTGKASPSAVTLAKLYGIEPAEYEKPEPVNFKPETDGEQISFDELLTISKAELKAIVKEATREVIAESIYYDPANKVYSLFIPEELVKIIKRG